MWPYGLCSYGSRASRDERGRVAVANCPSRGLSLDVDGYSVNVGKRWPCPSGPAWLRVEQKGHRWRSRHSTDETIERWRREGRQLLTARRRATWRSNILEQGEHLPSPKTACPSGGRAMESCVIGNDYAQFGGRSGGNTLGKPRRCAAAPTQLLRGRGASNGPLLPDQPTC